MSYPAVMTNYARKQNIKITNMGNIQLPSLVVTALMRLLNFCDSLFDDMMIKGQEDKSISVDKKNQIDVTCCILYFSSNSCSTCFGEPCALHQELTTV